MEEFTKINGDILTSLDVLLSSEQSQLITSLKKNAFTGTPELERLYLLFDGGNLTLPRGVFRPLTKLREVWIFGSVHLLFGSGDFTSSDLERLWLGNGQDTLIEFDPCSLSGIPAGAGIMISGSVNTGWQPSKFFNILRGGATIGVINSQDCGCDLAWIRYSNFLDQVDIDCNIDGEDAVSLSQYDLSHCSFHQHQSLHNTEL